MVNSSKTHLHEKAPNTFSAERMEVVRGSQGSLYGGDAMGGVLQILTHEPSYTDQDWQQEPLVVTMKRDGSIFIGKANGGTKFDCVSG